MPKAKGKQPEGRSCAVCRVPAAHTCGGCHQVTYCSADHQRQHWKSGGHKAKCAELKRRADEVAGKATANSTATGSAGLPPPPATDPSTATPEPKCHACEKPHPEMKKCGKCRFAWYCSAECQRGHWRIHKPNCIRIRYNAFGYNQAIKMQCVVCLQHMTTIECEKGEVQVVDCSHHLHVACWHKLNNTAETGSVCPVCRRWYQSKGSSEELSQLPHWSELPVDMMVWGLLGASFQTEAVDRTGNLDGAPLSDERDFTTSRIRAAKISGSSPLIASLLEASAKEVRAYMKDPVDAGVNSRCVEYVVAASVLLAGPVVDHVKWIPIFARWFGFELPESDEMWPRMYEGHRIYCENPMSPGKVIRHIFPLPADTPKDTAVIPFE
eukprot:m.277571 g.277571  ORF g.277571 m.277571 type:complete len:382 (-) comp16149_c0_seq7:9-1154(-)